MCFITAQEYACDICHMCFNKWVCNSNGKSLFLNAKSDYNNIQAKYLNDIENVSIIIDNVWYCFVKKLKKMFVGYKK